MKRKEEEFASMLSKKERQMRLAQDNFDAQLLGKDMEMRAAFDKQRLDMKRVLREHKDEMEKYRKEQE